MITDERLEEIRRGLATSLEEMVMMCTEILAARKRLALFERFAGVAAEAVDAAADGDTERENAADDRLMAMCADLWP